MSAGTDASAILLRTARWLLDNPEKHIRASLAVNNEGEARHPNAPDATCFCAVGRLALEAGFKAEAEKQAALQGEEWPDDDILRHALGAESFYTQVDGWFDALGFERGTMTTLYNTNDIQKEAAIQMLALLSTRV